MLKKSNFALLFLKLNVELTLKIWGLVQDLSDEDNVPNWNCHLKSTLQMWTYQ